MTGPGPPCRARLLMGLALKDRGKQSPLNQVKQKACLRPTTRIHAHTHTSVQNSPLPGVFLKTPAWPVMWAI